MTTEAKMKSSPFGIVLLLIGAVIVCYMMYLEFLAAKVLYGETFNDILFCSIVIIVVSVLYIFKDK